MGLLNPLKDAGEDAGLAAAQQITLEVPDAIARVSNVIVSPAIDRVRDEIVNNAIDRLRDEIVNPILQRLDRILNIVERIDLTPKA